MIVHQGRIVRNDQHQQKDFDEIDDEILEIIKMLNFIYCDKVGDFKCDE